MSRRDSELFADAGALEELGEDAREEYGKTLIQLSAHCKGRLSPLYTATTMSSGKRALRERIIGIAQGKAHMTGRAALGLLLILGVCLSCAFTGATVEEPVNTIFQDDSGREFLDLVARKNPDVIEEIRRDRAMAAVWMDIFKDEIDKRVNAREQDTTVDHIRSVMESLQVNSEKAMDVLRIPQNQRSTYAGLVKRV